MKKPYWYYRLDWDMIHAKSEKYGISPELIAAVIMTESSCNPEAVREEKHWKYYYKVSENAKRMGCPVDQEEYFQRISWGLMQVMGSVARELGYTGPLSALSDPDTGADLGCQKLAEVLSRYKDQNAAIASYNASAPRRIAETGKYRNQEYVDRVNKFMDQLKGCLDERKVSVRSNSRRSMRSETA